MRRLHLALLILPIGVVAIFVYSGITREREFQRLMSEGEQALAGNQPLLAVTAYSDALALRPNSMVVFLKRGETYQQHGNLQEAARDLAMAARLDPTATRPLERLGDVSYTLEKFDDAIVHYVAYSRLDDENPEVLYKLALVYQRVGQVPRAVPILRRAIALDSHFSEAHYLLGICLREQGRLEEARDALQDATDLSPGFLQAREALALVYHANGDRRAEVRQLEALAALDQDNPERHVSRGLAYARAGQTELALLALGRAAEDHPDQPQVYAALGRVWLEIAENRIDHVALILAPMYTEAAQQISLEEGERADTRYRQALDQVNRQALIQRMSTDQQYAQARTLQREIALDRTQRQDARLQYAIQKAANLKALEALLSVPTTSASSEALTLLGRALVLDDDIAGAKLAFRQATERFPLDPQAFLHLAELEELDQHWSEGRQLRLSHRALTTAYPNRTSTPSG